jgi:hypothetical protein
MEIVERRRQLATRPLLLIVVVLATMAIALLAWNAVPRPAVTRSQSPSAATMSSNLSPDAEQRNQEIRTAQMEAAEATHGN